MTPALNLARIACKPFTFTVSATVLGTEDPAQLTAVDVAVVRAGGSPDESTPWKTAQYVNGRGTVMLAGPDALNPPETAIIISEPGGDLWARIVDNPATDAAMLGRIILI